MILTIAAIFLFLFIVVSAKHGKDIPKIKTEQETLYDNLSPQDKERYHMFMIQDLGTIRDRSVKAFLEQSAKNAQSSTVQNTCSQNLLGQPGVKTAPVKKPAQHKTWNTSPHIEEKVVSSEVHYKNIAKTDRPLDYWVCPHPDLPGPSSAEQLIIEQLNRYRVKWDRECEFQGLQVNIWSRPRYDFVIQVPNAIGIIICEYDGAASHSTPEQKAMDRLKTLFCKQHSIPLHRLNKEHYYHMEETIARILSPYKIPLR